MEVKNNILSIIQQPTIRTQRLVLRPFVLADAPDLQRLAGDRKIAAMTLMIPHPYEDGMAEQWRFRNFQSLLMNKQVLI